MLVLLWVGISPFPTSKVVYVSGVFMYVTNVCLLFTEFFFLPHTSYVHKKSFVSAGVFLRMAGAGQGGPERRGQRGGPRHGEGGLRRRAHVHHRTKVLIYGCMLNLQVIHYPS